ncbi:hypothetical protein I307_05905 [Cryptococcus deuterogattii 99/473]|uniref:Major facilitator superfamily (MFS) profile domain-containing protein n=1 Tax=Cryptococcus deuterogattii Ram5 TaxID=1296110 RepID=A0A0D0T395_9TREE|nr:hypothetical protein I309_02397 [Cryptococcus deuterogattii LA55]KIR40217.1 hypothetical protein I313_03537 [Cryptococcus deuterogattii Ram5]KIR93493.1 hypothetical protein I304_02163 [Cryptococcus deuterogattii CBS 10090]KIY54721.1 hypothetical protein I307_05905 [Cryptococcus deuterogattii 99/473]
MSNSLPDIESADNRPWPTDDKYEIEHLDKIKPVPEVVVNDQEAAGYIDPTLIITEEENTRMRRKIHRRILPLICLGYLCQALDKASILQGFVTRSGIANKLRPQGTLTSASIMGWIHDVGAVGQDYSLTGTLLWCGIIFGEPLLLFGLGFSLSIPPVFAIRFLLGFFESLVGPTLIALTVQWYRVEEQPFVTSIWQSMLGISVAVSNLLAYGFYHIKDGVLHSWQWLHITIALVSLISATLIYIFLPDSPTKARWASEHEKKLLVERVRSNNQGLKQKNWNSGQAREAFTDLFTYCLFFLCFFNCLVVGGINTFSGLLITNAFGFSALNAQLLSIPLGVMGIISFLLIGWFIKKTNETCLCMVGFTIPNIAGTIVLLTVEQSNKTKGGLVAAFYIMQLFGACYPAVLMLLSRNSAGQTKKSITYAVTFIGWSSGNAIAPQIFQSKWATRYLHSLHIHLALCGEDVTGPAMQSRSCFE